MRSQDHDLKHFISEFISVSFDETPPYAKKPPCPSSFIWHERTFRIKTCLAEWKDFSRRGRMAQNMQPLHAEAASKTGSWGVGKFFFDVLTDEDRIFRLYYDRAPQDAQRRMGQWILLAELQSKQH